MNSEHADATFAVFASVQGANNDITSYTNGTVTDCMTFLIHGIEWAAVEPILRQGYVWQVNCSLGLFAPAVAMLLRPQASSLLVAEVF